MGTEATVQFRDPYGDLSCIVYGRGEDRVVNLAGQYAAELTHRNETEEPEGVMPLERFEASAVIVDFLQWLRHHDLAYREEAASYYRLLGPTERWAVTNGHHVINLPYRVEEGNANDDRESD